MEHSENINKLSVAICKAQKNFKTAIKRCKNPFFNSKYADYTEILSCVKEALNNEGVSILQPIHEDVVETVLLHESGEWISSITKIFNVSNKPQDYGSAITYARRYALSSILSIDSDDDDDGNLANGNHQTVQTKQTKSVQPKKIQQPQISKEARLDRIRRYIQYFLDHKKFENHAEIEAYLGVSLSDIPDNLDQVENKIKEFLERNK